MELVIWWAVTLIVGAEFARANRRPWLGQVGAHVADDAKRTLPRSRVSRVFASFGLLGWVQLIVLLCSLTAALLETAAVL